MTLNDFTRPTDSMAALINTTAESDDYTDYSSLSTTVEAALQTVTACEAYIGSFEEQEAAAPQQPPDPQEVRRHRLEKILSQISGLHLPGQEQMAEYVRDQYRRTCQYNTMRNTFIGLSLFLQFFAARGKERLQQLSREDLAAWVEHEQDRGLKPGTVKMRLHVVQAFARFLMDQELIDPTVLLKPLRVKIPEVLPRAMDAEDVRRLLEVLESVRDRALITVLLRTGMRIGELLNTLMQEVNIAERRIAITVAEKNRIGRVVYLSDDALSALQAWIRKRNPRKAYLFYSSQRPTLSYTAVLNRFRHYLAKADLIHKGYSPHCLRHTFATELLNAGMSLTCLQQLLGHSSADVTLRYARLSDTTRQEEYFTAMRRIEGGQTDEHR